MAGERGIEDNASEGVRRVVVVGAPGTGKGQLVLDLARKNGLFDISGMTTHPDLATGTLADYRVEMKLAIDRCFDMQVDEPRIFEHTLIDSLAYAATRAITISQMVGEDDPTLLKWTALTGLIGSLLSDSFKADQVFFIEAQTDDEQTVAIENALRSVLEATSLNFTTLSGTPEENMAEAHRVLQETVDGQSADYDESDAPQAG